MREPLAWRYTCLTRRAWPMFRRGGLVTGADITVKCDKRVEVTSSERNCWQACGGIATRRRTAGEKQAQREGCTGSPEARGEGQDNYESEGTHMTVQEFQARKIERMAQTVA